MGALVVVALAAAAAAAAAASAPSLRCIVEADGIPGGAQPVLLTEDDLRLIHRLFKWGMRCFQMLGQACVRRWFGVILVALSVRL